MKKEDNYKYYKFVEGRIFRVSEDEEVFQVINSNGEWEENDNIFFLYYDLGMDYEEITNTSKLNELKSLPTKEDEKRK